MRLSRALLVFAISTTLTACGKKEEAPPSAPGPEGKFAADLICSYAPSQSVVVSHLASAAGGAAAAATAIATAAGLTAVAHSSGAYIFTGAGGYLAGTIGTAIAGPVLVGVGVAVGGSAVTVELLCAPKNHPELVARVEGAAQDYFNRAKASVAGVSRVAKPIVAEAKVNLIKAGNEAFEYAGRKTVELSSTLSGRKE